jgi:hypothetical protein
MCYLGIDFSGNHAMWRNGCRTSNVWIAQGENAGSNVRIVDLRPVQELPGDGQPFQRLGRLLATGEGFAAIDAPFSVPARWGNDPNSIWRQVDAVHYEDRPFAKGQDLIRLLGLGHNLGTHEWRATEQMWRDRKLNVRSVVWNGPRGGAAFGVACMTMLARHRGAVWPFRSRGRGRVLAEAFPAAQLCQWGLPATGYNGTDLVHRERRAAILRSLIEGHGLVIADKWRGHCLDSADALDAVLCVFAAVAVRQDAVIPCRGPASEGAIAVHV